jgi:hypothetical protein
MIPAKTGELIALIYPGWSWDIASGQSLKRLSSNRGASTNNYGPDIQRPASG